MKKFATTTIFSLIALLVLATSGVTSTFASVAPFNASDFCKNGDTNCVKENKSGRSGSISCPNGQTITNVYVHAGDGQTVYQLPHTGFEVLYSNSNATATVTATTHQHDLSWLGVTCASGTTPTVTTTTTPSVTVTTTPSVTVTPTVTPACTPVSAPDPIQFEKKIGRFTNVFATYKWFEGPTGTWTLKIDIDPQGGENHRLWVTTYPNLWLFLKPVTLPQTIVVNTCTTPTVTVTPTATPTPTERPLGGPGDGLSDGRSDGRSDGKSSTPAVLGTSTLNDPYKGVLGANTMSKTGTFEQNLINLFGVMGMLLLGAAYKSYKKKLA